MYACSSVSTARHAVAIADIHGLRCSRQRILSCARRDFSVRGARSSDWRPFSAAARRVRSTSQPQGSERPLRRHTRLNYTVAAAPQPASTASLAAHLSKEQQLPIFHVKSHNVTLLEHPEAFYKHLLELIARARRRIVLASLYIGKSEHGLIDALADALSKRPNLNVVVLFDSLRSTREGPYTGEGGSESCASLLAGLKAQYPDRVQIRMYRAPGLPHWLEKLVGKRFVEGWGLQHMKIYGADDEVMISGANLSNDYFTNRRDRYISIADARLSDYMHRLALMTARYSFALKAPSREAPISEKGKGKEVRHAPYELIWDNGAELPKSTETQGGRVDAKYWKSSMRQEVLDLTKQWHEQSSTFSEDDSIEVVSMLQMGPLGVAQETTLVPKVLAAANAKEGSRLDFTTGYFSINPIYAQGILQGTFRCNMITAAPQANGFYGSRGISKYLPAAYTWLTQGFWRRLVAQGRDQHVTINEWSKKGWTYHAKGLWLHEPGASDPHVTLLGSSNFGTRSAKLDLECTLLIDASRSPALQRRLGEEVRELAKDATDHVNDDLFRRPERVVPLGVQIAARIIRRML